MFVFESENWNIRNFMIDMFIPEFWIRLAVCSNENFDSLLIEIIEPNVLIKRWKLI